jgi:hypothetical protein
MTNEEIRDRLLRIRALAYVLAPTSADLSPALTFNASAAWSGPECTWSLTINRPTDMMVNMVYKQVRGASCAECIDREYHRTRVFHAQTVDEVLTLVETALSREAALLEAELAQSRRTLEPRST